MKNLQDKWTDDKLGKGTLLFPKMKKMSTKIYKLLANNPHINITKSPARGVNAICKGLLSKRKLVCRQNICPSGTFPIWITKPKSSLYFT